MNRRPIKTLWTGLVAGIVALAASNGFGQQAVDAPAPPQIESIPTIGAAPLPQPAQPGALTVAQLEQMAMAHNPTLAQAARRVEALQGEQLQVGLYPNPVVGYQAEEIGDNGSAGQHGMFFTQEIVTANKLGLNRAVVSHEVQQAQWDFQIQQHRVVNAVRSRAYEALAAQRTVDLTEDLVRIGASAVQAAEQLYEAREVSQVDVLQARVEANSARLRLVAARKSYAAAWRQLAAVIGTPAMEPAPIAEAWDEGLPDLAWETAVAELIGESPQIARARAEVERARCALARAFAGQTPNFETGASVRYNDDSNDTTLSLQIGVPLLIHDRNQGNILKAHSELGAAQRNVDRVGLLLQEQLAEAFRQYEVAREQVEQYRQAILPDAKRSLDLVRIGYQQGEFGYLELLTAQQTYSRTNVTYVESLRELWLSAVQIEGMLMAGGLEAPGP